MIIVIDEATEFTKEQMEYLIKRMNANKDMGHKGSLKEQMEKLAEFSDKGRSITMKREHPSLATTIGADYLSALSTEVGEWANANFDSKDPLDPFIGLIEELGELATMERVNPLMIVVARMCHHVLKAKQGIRGTEEQHHANYEILRQDLYDLIFDGDLDWTNRADFTTPFGLDTPIVSKKGKILTADEVVAERKDAVGDIMIYLSDYCYRNGFDLGTITQETWAKVSQRDWRKNPVDAAEKAGD